MSTPRRTVRLLLELYAINETLQEQFKEAKAEGLDELAEAVRATAAQVTTTIGVLVKTEARLMKRDDDGKVVIEVPQERAP